MSNQDKSRHIETGLRHAGHDPKKYAGAVNPPVFRASTVLFDSLNHLRSASRAPFEQFYYGRFGTPTHEALAQVLNELSGAAGSVFYPSGLAAIAGVLLSFLKSGDDLLVADCVYGPSRKFCDVQLARMGISTRYFPAKAGADICDWIRPNTRLIFCESPGSLTMDLQDLPAICAIANQHNVPVVVDNTWATPLHCKVLELGAAVDIQAGTKYLGGHADLMLGAALCRADVYSQVRQDAQAFGYCVSPDDAWLALRGVRTLDIRIRQHAETAKVLRDWLRQQPEVSRILDPSDASHPQHEIWKRDFRGNNGLFSVEMGALSEAELAAFIDTLQLFGLGYSWGGFESLCLPFDVSKERADPALQQPGSYLRFHAGLEHPQDLLADLECGFAALRALRSA